MKKISLLLAAALLAACAIDENKVSQDTKQAVIDFIEIRELPKTNSVRTANRDSWDELDKNFVIYNTSKQSYLLQFLYRCWELDRYPVVPDVRGNPNEMRAGFDTLRGCRIEKIYPLTEGEADELRSIGESPGSRN